MTFGPAAVKAEFDLLPNSFYNRRMLLCSVLVTSRKTFLNLLSSYEDEM